MQKLTKQEVYEKFLYGTQVEVSKKPTRVFARWVENYDLCTKASGTVDDERNGVTGWLVQPQHDKKNLYVLDDEQMRKCYSPMTTESYLYENKYSACGYELPKLIFWNVSCYNDGTVPIQSSRNGVILLSGFSKELVDMVCCSDLDPYKALCRQLNKHRYDIVEEIFN